MKSYIILFFGAVLFAAGHLYADLLTRQDRLDDKTTGDVGTLSVDQFNPSSGVLNKVNVTLYARLKGQGKYENFSRLSPGQWGYSLNQYLNIEFLSDPRLTLGQDYVQQLAETATFDGILDFLGASGDTGDAHHVENTVMLSFFGTDMAPFIGTGTIRFDILTDAVSNQNGSGTLVSHIRSLYDAEVVVEYDYLGDVPEPASMSLLCAGGLFLFRRKKPKA